MDDQQINPLQAMASMFSEYVEEKQNGSDSYTANSVVNLSTAETADHHSSSYLEPGPSTSSGIVLTAPHTEDNPLINSDSQATSKNPFHVDTSLISAIPVHEQASELQDLGLRVFNQDEFEEGESFQF